MAQPKTDASGRIQPPTNNNNAPPATLAGLLQSKGMMAEIKRALPTHLNAERMTRILITAVRNTPNLAKCDQLSFMGCVLQASQLGLEVNTALGHCYLIPRRDKKTGNYYCTMIIGYQGLMELANRSGRVSSIKTIVVRQGDSFVHKDGLRPVLEFTPAEDADREHRPITHVISIAYMKDRDAEPIFEVLSRAQIEARMNRSESLNSSYSPWKTDFEAMARKTGVRSLSKWIPKSPEMAVAQHLEDARERGERQAYSAEVANAIDTMGYEVDAQRGAEDLPVPDDVDPDTGETRGYQHPDGSTQQSS